MWWQKVRRTGSLFVSIPRLLTASTYGSVMFEYITLNDDWQGTRGVNEKFTWYPYAKLTCMGPSLPW